MKHGIKVDMIPTKYGGTGGITVEGEVLPYRFDQEKLFWDISMPTRDDMDTLKWIESLTHQLCWVKNVSEDARKLKYPTTSHGTNGADV